MFKSETPFAGFKYGLGRKLIIYILLFSSLITLIGTSLQLYVDYSKDKLLLDERMNQIEDSYLETLANAMWISNKNMLGTQLKGILQLPDIEYLDIEIDGDTAISVGKPQAENVVSRTFPILYEYKGKNIHLGTLHVVASLDGIQRRLLDRVLIILTTQAIKTFLVSAFIFFVFYFLIGAHLTSLAAYARSLDLESLGVPFSLNRPRNKKGREDELDFLENSINKMRIKLKEAYVERKKAEEEIERQKTMFESIFNAVADAIAFTDTQRKIITCNSGFTRILGYSQQEVIGKEAGMFYESLEVYKKMGEERFNLSAQEKLKPYVVDYRRKNGTVFPGETIGTIMRNKNGEIVGFLGVIRDITDRKLAEIELASHRDHLEELVEARTNELTSVNKELESFAYSVSHDLRAPLRGIDGFSKILLNDYGDKMEDGAKNYLSRVCAAAMRMALLIDDLLILSRVTRSKMMSGQVNLSALACDVVDDLRKECPECTVELTIEEGLVTHGDERLLRVVVYNLVSNAWKFTGKRSGASIEFGSTIRDGKMVYFVRDNGVGFDMKYAGKLFGAFQRLHTMSQFPGTGIGLATVQRIIHRHGGRVWAEGEVGKGATFYFTL